MGGVGVDDLEALTLVRLLIDADVDQAIMVRTEIEDFGSRTYWCCCSRESLKNEVRILRLMEENLNVRLATLRRMETKLMFIENNELSVTANSFSAINSEVNEFLLSIRKQSKVRNTQVINDDRSAMGGDEPGLMGTRDEFPADTVLSTSGGYGDLKEDLSLSLIPGLLST